MSSRPTSRSMTSSLFISLIKNFAHTFDSALEKIELYLRASMSHVLSLKYGTFAHEDSSIFFSKIDHEKWINNVHLEAKRSKENFVTHYKNKYLNFPTLPTWVAVEIMSFGSLSLLFNNLKNEVQMDIAKEINIHPTLLGSWLHTLVYIRNMCAHHGRIWNRELSIRPKIPKHGEIWRSLIAQNISSVFLIIRYLFLKMPNGIQYDLQWSSELLTLISTPQKTRNFYRSMGFNEDHSIKEIFSTTP